MIRLLLSCFLLSLTLMGFSSCAGPKSDAADSSATMTPGEAAAKPAATAVATLDRESIRDDYWSLAMKRYQLPRSGTGLQPITLEIDTPVTNTTPQDASLTPDAAVPTGPTVSTAAPAPKPDLNPADIPFATWAPGKRGMVTSPFDPNGKPIDVREFNAGQMARCPYSGKIFRVPPAK